METFYQTETLCSILPNTNMGELHCIAFLGVKLKYYICNIFISILYVYLCCS